jgi:hypothetical protein
MEGATEALAQATNASVLTEPILFYFPFKPADAKQPLLRHAAGLREVTRAEFVSPLLAFCPRK